MSVVLLVNANAGWPFTGSLSAGSDRAQGFLADVEGLAVTVNPGHARLPEPTEHGLVQVDHAAPLVQALYAGRWCHLPPDGVTLDPFAQRRVIQDPAEKVFMTLERTEPEFSASSDTLTRLDVQEATQIELVLGLVGVDDALVAIEPVNLGEIMR